jgi:hypothetical protein
MSQKEKKKKIKNKTQQEEKPKNAEGSRKMALNTTS